MDITQAFAQIQASQYPMIMGLLVLADFLTGVTSAVRRRVFSWDKLGDVFPHNVLSLILATGAQVLSTSTAGTLANYLTPAVFAVFAATLAASIWSNLQEILASIPAAPSPPPVKPA